ncbi:MAG: methionyl-tRNA formyltransferase [Clostridia bacterium]|nr:methionyl-tRNA formyltransferase [Clostridia bacterium]
MRIVYMGTPDFAVLPLKYLVENNYEVVAVVTNLDKPIGRKQILTPPPVKSFALERNIPVFQYGKIRAEGVQDLIDLKPDIIITCAFGQILSQEIIDIPSLGVINIHASLLPELRGASPIHYAILNGLKKTGITIMRTDIGIDTGDIICQREIEIKDDETCGELFERLSVLGAECIVEALPSIIDGSAKYIKQDEDKVTFSKIIKKDLAQIDWTESAEQNYNKVRAFNPAPVAFTFFNGEPFKIYQAKALDNSGVPGTILKSDNELIVACGKGSLSLLKVQKAGSKPMSASDFLRGNKLTVGEELH